MEKGEVERIPAERVARAIVLVRGQRVLLDRDLAVLYGVETRVLNQAVRRNIVRFPPDFLFMLTREEIRDISQIVTCSSIKHARSVSAFTEQGVAMLSSVLKVNGRLRSISPSCGRSCGCARRCRYGRTSSPSSPIWSVRSQGMMRVSARYSMPSGNSCPPRRDPGARSGSASRRGDRATVCPGVGSEDDDGDLRLA